MIVSLRARLTAPGLAAMLAVGLTLIVLFVGYEPIGGDPDVMYRPIKSELARSLRAGTLPFWSNRFGLGVPLVAESHIAAFYPPNWFLYRLLSVPSAYRLTMWLHCVATAAATYAYARSLGLGGWGGSLAAIAFSLCGFQAIHSGHEPFYHVMPYLPLCLMAAHRVAADGRLGWLALLALAWAAQLTLGHFQIQMWTGGLSLLTGTWRVLGDHRPKSRIFALALALVWGLSIAGVQLALTWELRKIAGFARPFEHLSNFAMPPAHWAQAALPALFVRPWGYDEGVYWSSLLTGSGEATFYVGTLPLLFAFIGLIGDGRLKSLAPWRLIVPASWALATMPLWWPFGYWLLTLIPGLGWFRCPARYTLITSLGVSLLAGHGLDRSISSGRFRAGLMLAITFGLASLAWGVVLVGNPSFRSTLGESTLPYRFGAAVLAWSISLAAVIAWRRGNLGAWMVLALTTLELGALYYLGPVRWGWTVPFPDQSPIMRRLADEPGPGLIASPLENLPVRAGYTTAYPYLGITAPPPNYLLEASKLPGSSSDPGASPWLRRFGVTHGIWHENDAIANSETRFIAPDRSLDRLVGGPGEPSPRPNWKIVRYPSAWPSAWACRVASEASSWQELYTRLIRSESRDEALFLREDAPPEARSPRARSARVLSWDGRTAVVEHDGACDLIVRRTFYPGWTARVDGGSARPVSKVNGGLQSVRLDGSGTSRVRFSYRPSYLAFASVVSLGSLAAALIVLAFAGFRGHFLPLRAVPAAAPENGVSPRSEAAL